MTKGIERANRALEQLRASWTTGEVVDNVPLIERVWMDPDPEQKDLSIVYDSQGPGLISLSTKTATQGRWLTLNVNLESGSLAGMRVVGFAAKMRDLRTQTIRARIRSFRETGFDDVFFPMDLYVSDVETSHCNILWVAEHETLIQPAQWRALLLFLEPKEFTLEISELNVFVG